MIEITRCLDDSAFSVARRLTKDYIAWLNMDLSFQDIEAELAHFPSMYGPPQGVFLLAWQAGQLMGGVGARRLTPTICEMKRLFVYNAFTGNGVGRCLCVTLIAEAKMLGYHTMRLDTLGRMQAAITLYTRLGFHDIAPYRFNPDPTARYMELSLA